MSGLSKLDIHEKGYILEVSENLAQLFESMAKLLAHPLQRSSQHSACYTLKLDNVPQIDLNAIS